MIIDSGFGRNFESALIELLDDWHPFYLIGVQNTSGKDEAHEVIGKDEPRSFLWSVIVALIRD